MGVVHGWKKALYTFKNSVTLVYELCMVLQLRLCSHLTRLYTLVEPNKPHYMKCIFMKLS